jgi:hypothetical protein
MVASNPIGRVCRMLYIGCMSVKRIMLVGVIALLFIPGQRRTACAVIGGLE